MPDVKLKVDGRAIPLTADITTIGRTTDNEVSFPDDANVSRNHAEIELRGNEYCLIDLGSSNGTTVNGAKVNGDVYLKPGDVIVLGGSSRIEFGAENGDADEPKDEERPAAVDTVPDAPQSSNLPSASPSAPAAEASSSGGSKTILLVAGVIACVAILFVAVAAAVLLLGGRSGGSSGTSGGSSGGSSGGWFGSLFGSTCDAKATITKPESGDTISASTEIELDVENGECVSKAVFTIDGQEFTSAESPFSASVDPKEFPELSDGVDHSLGVILIDEDGSPIGENASVMLAFETRAVTKPPTNTQVTQTNTQQTTTQAAGKVSLIEIQDMTKRIAQQFAGKNAHNVSNKQFLTEVQKRTAEYAQEGYFERATRYRDAINVGFVREQNLDPSIGFLLAMSRSKFDPARQGSDEGLWRMNTEFVSSNAYNGPCGGESLSDPSQNCAAKASALYMKAIVYGVFDGDLIYSAAVFGKSPQDAGIWKATLPANRSDVWNSIKTPQEREQLVRFFAAGIVAENPQKFGLKKDRPLSELYRVAM
jgi:pSer/pThr/pTyr-binding forkhead associated (FHA) protein